MATGFEGEDRRKRDRRQGQNRRADDPQEYYPEEVDRIRTNVVEHLKRRKKGPVPRFSCPRCPGFLMVHRPVRWAEVTVFEVTCSGCPRRAIIREAPGDATYASGLKGLLRRFFS